jgi:hypothetical protein
MGSFGFVLTTVLACQNSLWLFYNFQDGFGNFIAEVVLFHLNIGWIRLGTENQSSSSGITRSEQRRYFVADVKPI